MRVKSRRAFTLIEAVLALALAVVVLGLLSLGVNLYLRAFGAGRGDVEETQLARALLGMIADDLRSAVPYDPERSGSGASGLIGDRLQLQLDVERVAAIDPYQALLASQGGGAPVSPTSGVQTLAYYVADEMTAGSSAIESVDGIPLMLQSGASSEYGLVRQRLDRAVAAHAAEQGLFDTLDSGGELLAPEVAAIEFRYFDGTEWAEEWDTSTRGGLPVAVEVAIALRPPGAGDFEAISTAAATSLDMLAVDTGLRIYRLLVRLPTAEPTTSESSLVEEDLLGELEP